MASGLAAIHREHFSVSHGAILARLIAFYLPQFHPIPENDEWWGRGFTEWTNTARAKPLFPGHYQPHVPADLGYYDLRLPETRAAQAAMARAYSVEAFCYYHYWFAGRRILDRPFNEVLASGEPDFPFCLCWANQTWTGIWHGEPDRVLIEQTYPGPDDHRRHFDALLPAFHDRRYVRVDDKPIFVFFRPADLPETKATTELWRRMAQDAGLGDLFLLGTNVPDRWTFSDLGLDGAIVGKLPRLHPWVSRRTLIKWLRRKYQDAAGMPTIYRYEEVIPQWSRADAFAAGAYPCLIPSWDNTPRSGRNGLVLHGATPQLFEAHARRIEAGVRDRAAHENLVFIKSWNEWAEGNHLEPDQKFGLGFLEAMRRVFPVGRDLGAVDDARVGSDPPAMAERLLP